MKTAGAELVDISLRAIGEQMRGSALIDAEFKFDLIGLSVAMARRAGALAR